MAPTIARSSKGLAASFTIVLAAALAVFWAAPASAAPTVTTTVKVADASATDGLTIDVTGSGYTDLPNPTATPTPQGVYVALRDKNTMSVDQINANPDIVDAVQFIYKGKIHDGKFSTTLKAPTSKLDAKGDYQVIVWTAHGNITDSTLLDTKAVTLTGAQRDALFSASATSSPSAAPSSTTSAAPTSSTTSKAPTSATPTSAPSQAVQCTTTTVPAKPGTASLKWGVKSQFVTYIEGSIADGKVITSGGATETDNGFTWGHGTGHLNANGDGTLTFPGSVRFTGHDGALDTTLSDLRVEITGENSGKLVLNAKSKTESGQDASGTNITFATLTFSSLSQTGGKADVAITSAGAHVLSGFYPAGEALDPLTVSITGGSSATTEQVCHNASGARVNPDGSPYTGGNLAFTGTPDIAPILGFGGLLILLGAGALLTTRRRAHAHQQ